MVLNYLLPEKRRLGCLIIITVSRLELGLIGIEIEYCLNRRFILLLGVFHGFTRVYIL